MNPIKTPPAKYNSNCSIITEQETTKILDLKNQLLIRCRAWANITSFHGIQNIVKTVQLWRKIFWLIFFLGMVGLCVFSVQKLLIDYFKFEVTTTIRTIPQTGDQQFPVVSICNQNPYVSPDANKYLQTYFINKFNITATSFEDLVKNLGLQNTIKEINWAFYLMANNQINENKSHEIGYDVENVFYVMRYAGDDFNLTQLERFFDPFYGPCFRFNSGKDANGDSIKVENAVFEGAGLEIVVFVGPSRSNYLFEPQTRGILVEIKDQDGYPYLTNYISIEPGLNTIIKLAKTQSQTLEWPYSDCIDTSPPDFRRLEIATYVLGLESLGIEYTREKCMELLMQDAIIESFGCYDLRLLNFRKNFSACMNQSDLIDFDAIEVVYNMSYVDLYCPIECESIVYKLAVSNDEFPTRRFYAEAIRERSEYFEQLFGMNASSITYEMFKRSYTSVFIYYEQLVVTYVKEEPVMQLVNLVSDLGGTIGIFLGVSLVSVVELIELVVVLVIIWVKDKWRPQVEVTHL